MKLTRQQEGAVYETCGILLLCIGAYLAGEYGQGGSITWEGIFGGVMMLTGFLGYLFATDMRNDVSKQKEVTE